MEWVANLHTKEHTNKQGYSGLRTSSWNCQYNTPNLFDFANMLVNGITILHNFESILLKKKKDVEDLWGCACLAIWANVFSFSFAFYYLYTRKKVQHKCFFWSDKSSTQMFSCAIKQRVLFPTMLEIGCLYCRYTTGVTKTLEV